MANALNLLNKFSQLDNPFSYALFQHIEVIEEVLSSEQSPISQIASAQMFPL